MRRRPALASLCALLALLLVSPVAAEERLVLATTTSVRDSGLLDDLLPAFERRNGVAVQVVAVGTGAALRMGREGNADVLLTHAPEAEAELVATGLALDRRPFMENHFVIAGPSEDPAGVAGAASPEEAFRRIAEAAARYVSRGDDSGTHKRELALLVGAGLAKEGDWSGFATTGQGMGLTLMVAGERRAYVLSDIGTFLAFRERTELAVLSKPAPSLRNVYSVLRIDPTRFDREVNSGDAEQLANFLVAPETQRRIAGFGSERFGRPLFRPLLEVAEAPGAGAIEGSPPEGGSSTP